MLTFVGVGPGDPELLTLKAERILTSEADAIALPDSGAALRIVERFIGNKPVLKLNIPMRGNRADWIQAHRDAAEQLRSWLKQYDHIAYPVLGDPGIYASSSYLMRLIQPSHTCQVIPGIPSMCAAAAQLGIPLCEQRETLTVVDSLGEDDALPGGNVVVMKGGKHIAALKEKAKERECYAVRNLGMANEWTGPLKEMSEGEYSYFTTVLIRK